MILFKKKKKRKAAGRVCPAERPPRRGEGERHTSILLAEAWNAEQGFCQKALSRGRASEPETFVAPRWFPIPHPPKKGKGGLSTRGLILVPCGAGLMASHATRLYLPFQEPQEAAQMSTLSPGRSQNKSLFTIPSSAPLLVGKHSFIRS